LYELYADAQEHSRADLILDEENGYIDKVVATHDVARLPIGTTWITGPEAGCANRGQLDDWWRGRTIPASREGFEPLLLGLGFARLLRFHKRLMA